MAIQTRNTRQKDAIRAAFAGANRPLSHDEALALAQQQVDGLSTATLYRNINLLLEEGWLSPVDLPGATTRYEVAGKDHHHHFQCNRCGKLFELEGCAVGFKPAVPSGFRTTGHELFVYGLCNACV
jgi:Fur family ferric uptake transcriptional regulator